MTQRTDFGAIANQQGAFFRGAVNGGFQAVATQHYGAPEPNPMYANMIWFSAGDGYIKLRSPTNTSWQNIGVIGPPAKWTNIDLPQESFVTGDIKGTYNPAQPDGWQHMNDGTIGNQWSGAQSRSNPDCWPLFNLLWYVASDDWCSVYASGTMARTGKGASAANDWNLHRHIALPKIVGRTPVSSGWGAGLSNWNVATWIGQETVVLESGHIPPHAHAFSANLPAHSHSLPLPLANFVGGKGSTSGGFTLADQPSGNTSTNSSGSGTVSGITNSVGYAFPLWNIQPSTFVNYFIKL